MFRTSMNNSSRTRSKENWESTLQCTKRTSFNNSMKNPLRVDSSQDTFSEEKYSKDLENAIKNMTGQKFEDDFSDLMPKKKKVVPNYDTDFKDILEQDPATIKIKVKNKLKLLGRYQNLMNYVNVSANIQKFIENLIKWFRNEQPKGCDFMVTPKGCLFNNPEIEKIEQGSLVQDMKLVNKSDGFNENENTVIMTDKDTILEGKFEFDSCQDGKICALFSNGDYYEGECQGNLKHGKGVLYFMPKHINLLKDSRKMKFEYNMYNGDFVDNKKIGKAFLRFHDGCEYIGQFMDDEIEGNGVFTDLEGNKYKTFSTEEHSRPRKVYSKKRGAFVKGKLYGLGEILYKNDNIYDGNLKGSKRDGKGKMTYVVSETEDINDVGFYEGNWVRDQRSGEGIMRFENGELFEGQWKNNMMHYGKLTYQDETYYNILVVLNQIYYELYKV